MGPKKNKLLTLALSVIWFSAVSAGIWMLWNYENTVSAPIIQAPSLWPSNSQIQRDNSRSTLVMLVHPHCPCTRASISELARLMAQAEGRVTAYVLFNKPSNLLPQWERTDLWDSAAAIPGVNVLRDDEGLEARRFHAAISGQTMLYDKEGALRFSGGITSTRGHEGDNAGRSAIVSLLMTGDANQTETPVFGCELFAQDECPTGKEVSHPIRSN